MTADERLDRLERSSKRWRWVAGLAITFILLLVANLNQKVGAEKLVAREIALHDESGRPRIGLVAKDSGPEVFLLDEQGERRLQLSAHGPAANVLLWDSPDAVRMMMASGGPGNVPVLALFGADGRSVMQLEVDEHDRPLIRIWGEDESGQRVVVRQLHPEQE